MAKVTIKDFGGGLTDFIFDSPINQAESIINYDLTREHKLKVRNGSRLYSDGMEQIPAGNQRVGSLFKLNDTIFTQSLNKLYYDNSTAWSTLQGPSSGDLFSLMTSSSYASFARWNEHILAVSDAFDVPQKIFKDSSGDFQLRTAGLPALASSPTITPDADDSKSYIYRFYYSNEYSVGDLDFLDQGATYQVVAGNSADFSGVGHYNQISTIPELTGGNYDTTNINIQIYRTIDNGTTFYKVGEVSNGTTTFEDTVTDVLLVDNQVLYTEGGVYDNDAPPLSKYVVVTNDIAWYLNVKENSEQYNYRIRQSIRSDVDSCPESFFVDLDDEIKGGGAVGIKPIIMTNSKIYRLDGYVDFTGRGVIDPVIIHDTAGCLSHNSVIQSSRGLYWAGKDGFYWTNGFDVKKISSHILDTYRALTATDDQKAKITAAYDNNDDTVYWSMSTGTENDILLVMYEDLIHQNTKGEVEGSFSTWTGGDSFAPTAILYDNYNFHRGDSRGYMFTHASAYVDDPVVNVLTSVDVWDTQVIDYSWKHIAFDFGAADINKWVNKVTIGFQNDSNLHIQINSYDDGKVVPRALKEVTYTNDLTWGSSEWIWSSSVPIWREQLLFSKTRRMLKGKIRTRYKQLELTNAESVLDYSNISSTANISNASNSITLTDTDYRFWNNCEGYEIRYSTDGGSTYSDWIEIIDRIDDQTLELDNSVTLTDTSGAKWEMQGMSKVERAHVNSITFTYEVLSDKQDGGYYKTSQSEGN